MADNRTGLSPADIAKLFRDRCGDGSVEWVYTPTQTWVLLDAADMLDENAKLREQIHWLKQGDILHVLTDQEYIDQCERERLMQVSIDALDKENAKLRELVRDMAAEMRGLGVDFKRVGWCDYADRMRELGVDA